MRSPGGLAALGFAVALAGLAPRGASAAAPDGPAAEWVERMVRALRLDGTLAARIRAHTVDYTKSERDVVIELLRDARGPTMRTLVEVRDADPASRLDPVVFRIDSLPDGSVVSWIWDLRWHHFVEMSGLDGTESFDGTHFRLEDLGFTGLESRKSGRVRELDDPPGTVEVISEAYHYYGRVETRIDRNTGLPLRTHIYDGTGARIWEIEFGGVQTIGGRAIATRMRAENPVTHERSTLDWSQIAVGLRIADDAFDLERLDAVIRRGGDPIEMPTKEQRAGRAGSATRP